MIATDARPRLVVRNLSVRRGAVRILEAFNLEVHPGEAVWLRGPNGCGKSTLLHAIFGNLPVEEGEVLVDGRSPRLMEAWERECILPFATQDAALQLEVPSVDNLVDALLLRDSMLSWLRPRRIARKQALAMCGDMIERLGLERTMPLPAGELSLGQRKMLTLVRALRLDPRGSPRVAMLDEPLAGLRDDKVQQVITSIQQRIDEGWSVLVSEHVEAISTLRPLREARMGPR